MKRMSHLYEKLIDAGYLEKCIYKAFKKKKKTNSIKRILLNPRKHAERISMLIQQGKLPAMKERKIKLIRDGSQKKWRTMTKASEYEHIVHHAVTGLLEERITNSSYRYSVSSMPKRGDLYGKRHLERWVRSYRGRKVYVLKFDIKKFFDTVDRKILLERLCRIVKDRRFIDILTKIVYFDNSATNRGIPIGYYTSQWFSNFYLMAFDNFVKQGLRIRHMMRYADDVVLLNQNKRCLHNAFRDICQFLKDKLALAVKSNWQVFKLSYRLTRLMIEDGWSEDHIYGRPIDFMGYKFYPWKTTIRKSTLKSAKRALIHFQKNETARNAMSLMSYYGRLWHADTFSCMANWPVSKKRLSKIISTERNNAIMHTELETSITDLQA